MRNKWDVPSAFLADVWRVFLGERKGSELLEMISIPWKTQKWESSNVLTTTIFKTVSYKGNLCKDKTPESVPCSFFRLMHGMYTKTTQWQRKMWQKSKPVFRERTENFSMQAKHAGNFHWAMSKVLIRAQPRQGNENSLRLDIIFVSAKTT